MSSELQRFIRGMFLSPRHRLKTQVLVLVGVQTWSVVSRQPLAPSCRKLLNLSGRTITETNQQRQSLSSSDLCVSVLWACEEASSARPSHSSIDLFNSVVRRGSVAQEQQLRLQYKNKTKQNKKKATGRVCVWGDGQTGVAGCEGKRQETDGARQKQRQT